MPNPDPAREAAEMIQQDPNLLGLDDLAAYIRSAYAPAVNAARDALAFIEYAADAFKAAEQDRKDTGALDFEVAKYNAAKARQTARRLRDVLPPEEGP